MKKLIFALILGTSVCAFANDYKAPTVNKDTKLNKEPVNSTKTDEYLRARDGDSRMKEGVREYSIDEPAVNEDTKLNKLPASSEKMKKAPKMKKGY